jgi:putative transposase
MATRSFSFSLHENYHVFNRGIEKRIIFDDSQDKERFQKLLYLCNGTKSLDLRELPPVSAYDVDVGDKLVAIGAYALMDNHYHLLIKEIVEGGISNFMLKLGTSHSMYYNLKHDRTGRLFEGTFKGRHAADDEYLKYLFAYIHLNPKALAGLGTDATLSSVEFLRSYPFSSFVDHVGVSRSENKILDLSAFPSYFSNVSEYLEDMKFWLDYPEG